MRILIVKLSSFGDVIHAFPAVTDLRLALPGVEIDWLVEEALAPFVRLHPAVADVHPLAFRRLRWPPARWSALGSGMLALRKRLRARRYDLVVDLQGLMKSAVAAKLAGVPVSGYDAASAREPGATRLYRRRFAVPKDLHAVERTRRLLAAAMGYPVPQAMGEFGIISDRSAAGIGVPGRYVVAAHSASWPSKLWLEERWRAVIERLVRDGRSVVLPWGSDDEKQRAERLASGLDGVFVLPRVLSGGELAAILGRSDLAVGLDSGLMHLSAALNVPGVWLFGPTDPGLTGPYGDRQTVVRSTHPAAPCRRRECDHPPGTCMSAISLAEVEAAISSSLESD